VERVEVNIDYFEKVLSNSGLSENISEYEKYKRNNYYEIIRQLRKNNIKNIEVDEADFKEYENEYKLTGPIHNDYREFVLRAFKEHEKDLHNTIDRHIVGTKEGKSYISKDEVREMLEEHFEKVDNLLGEYDANTKSGFSLSESFNDLKENMKKVATEFKESLIKRVNKAKKSFNDKVQDVKDSARKQVNASVNKINDQVKNLSNKLDRFVEVEDNNSKERNIQVVEQNGIHVSNDRVEKLYEHHKECFSDILSLHEVDAEEYDMQWLSNPDEIEHRSFSEAQYYASRNVLLTLDLESEQSLADLEKRFEAEYHKDRQKESSAELDM